MITFFSIPKPFDGHIGITQRNALQSWARQDGCEVLLLGREAGTEAAAREVGAVWIPDVAVNEYGTPLVNSAFALARARARHPLLCYINADIIVLSDFTSAARRIPRQPFLMVGQRWDLDLATPVDFGRPQWEADVRELVSARGVLHPPTGSDYFLFPRDSALAELPPFAVGRPVWDNWLIWRARHLGIAVVDATPSVTIVHQNHDYRHVKAATGRNWEGPEADRNRALAADADHVHTLADATHRLDSDGLRATASPAQRALEAVRSAIRHWRRR